MRGLRYLGRNAEPTGNDSADAFDTLNEMLAGFNRESLLLPYELIYAYTLTSGAALYTIGLTGNIAIARPDRIERASFRGGTGASNYYEVPIFCAQTARDWQKILSKSSTSTQPTAIWYNPKVIAGELNVYPTPSGTPTILLYIQDRLTQLTDLSTEFNLDDGMLQMIRFNLGVKLQPELGVPLPDGWLDQAISTKAVIKSSNIKPGTLELHDVPGQSGRYLIGSDSFRQ